jgi:hypothetical protein
MPDLMEDDNLRARGPECTLGGHHIHVNRAHINGKIWPRFSTLGYQVSGIPLLVEMDVFDPIDLTEHNDAGLPILDLEYHAGMTVREWLKDYRDPLVSPPRRH